MNEEVTDETAEMFERCMKAAGPEAVVMTRGELRERDARIVRAAYAFNYEHGRHSHPFGHEIDAIIAAAEADA